MVRDGVLYFASGVFEIRVLRSSLAFPSNRADCEDLGDTFVPPNSCCLKGMPDAPTLSAPLEAEDLSKFVPPFHIEGP